MGTDDLMLGGSSAMDEYPTQRGVVSFHVIETGDKHQRNGSLCFYVDFTTNSSNSEVVDPHNYRPNVPSTPCKIANIKILKKRLFALQFLVKFRVLIKCRSPAKKPATSISEPHSS